MRLKVKENCSSQNECDLIKQIHIDNPNDVMEKLPIEGILFQEA